LTISIEFLIAASLFIWIIIPPPFSGKILPQPRKGDNTEKECLIMYACDYLENGILNALRGVTFAAPAKCYLALYLNDPGESGTAGTEVSYTGYKRMEIDFSAPADSNGGIGVQNLTDITFPTPVSAAGTITHIGVMDSLTGGNMLARGELVEPLIIGAEEPPVFLAGDVLFYLTGNLSKAWKTKVLNILRGNSIQGITPYFSLWNGSPESSGSELSGDNYQRVPLTFGAPTEQTSGQIIARSSQAAAFPRPSTAWGTWTYSALYSAETSGEPVYIKPLTESVELKRGYMPTIAEGAVEVGIN
jgi:hypothetical protein